jgi:hypothetical protein
MPTSRNRAGREADLLRHRVYGERQVTDQGRAGDFSMLAYFIAGVVRLYEYFDDPSTPPRRLGKATLEGGLFREGGKELRFLDGRPAKRFLAVSDKDLECATALLKDPEHAAQIRSRFERFKAQKLKARARTLRAESAQLLAKAIRFR